MLTRSSLITSKAGTVLTRSSLITSKAGTVLARSLLTQKVVNNFFELEIHSERLCVPDS